MGLLRTEGSLSGQVGEIKKPLKSEVPHCSVEHDYSCERPRLEYADGGRYVKLSFGLSPAAEWNAEMFHRRAEGRGKCKGFSFGSRRRMLARLNSVSVAAEMPAFFTATLPDEVFCDSVSEFAARAKVWMDTFIKRLVRVVPGAAGFWRIEWQARKSGAHEGKLFPHFHVLVWGLPHRNLGWQTVVREGEEFTFEMMEPYVPVRDAQQTLELLGTLSRRADWSDRSEPLGQWEQRREYGPCNGLPRYVFQGRSKFLNRCDRLWVKCHIAADHPDSEEARQMSFQDWASLAWYHIVDSHCVDHLKAGVRVEAVRTWGGVLSYCSKYMAKSDCGFLSEVAFGRSWGIFNRAAVPWAKLVHLDLDEDSGVRLRRIFRRYLERRIGCQRKFAYGVTVFCDVAQFKKLWERPPPDPF